MLVAGCTSSAGSDQRAAAPSSSAGSTSMPAGVSELPSVAGAALVECRWSIAARPDPPGDYQVVVQDVAVPTTSVLQANESGETDPAMRLFAKWGLVVGAGAGGSGTDRLGQPGLARRGGSRTGLSGTVWAGRVAGLCRWHLGRAARMRAVDRSVARAGGPGAPGRRRAVRWCQRSVRVCRLDRYRVGRTDCVPPTGRRCSAVLAPGACCGETDGTRSRRRLAWAISGGGPRARRTPI